MGSFCCHGGQDLDNTFWSVLELDGRKMRKERRCSRTGQESVRESDLEAEVQGSLAFLCEWEVTVSQMSFTKLFLDMTF